jgi:hypothetical protein
MYDPRPGERAATEPRRPRRNRDTLTDMATRTGAGLGFRPIFEFEGVYDIWPRGNRPQAIRQAAERFRRRFKSQGEVLGVRSIDIATAPYLARYAFHGAARTPNPYLSITNRMLIVQFEDWGGSRRTLVWEPTDPDGSAAAPFYSQMLERSRRAFVYRALEKVYHQQHTLPADALQSAGIAPEEVDFISFDHLHVQDPRLILPRFPAAKLLVQDREIATLKSLHPMQWLWYVERGLEGVSAERIELLDGDFELGRGVAIAWTPGHTDGNHSLVLNTPDGIWVSSENGVSADNWQPELSKIPGVRQYAVGSQREVCPNANTLEDSIDQYDSMLKEKALADFSQRNPRWKQILPSSELTGSKRQWPVLPTYSHGGIEYGVLEAR